MLEIPPSPLRASETPRGFTELRSRLALTERLLVDRTRSLFFWAVGLVAYAVLIVSLFPTFRDSASFSEALEDYPDAIKEFMGGEAAFDLTSGPGFVSAEMYALILPALLAVVAIGSGASMGSDQREGRMDVLLANPLSRRSVVLQRALAMTVSMIWLAGVSAVAVLAAGSFVDLGIGLSNLVAASLGLILMVVFHGLLAMLAGVLTGRRGAAIGVATTAFVAGYLLNGLGGIAGWLEPYRPLSPYFHAVGGNPLSEGWDVSGLGILAIACLTLLAAAVVAFDRRDIG